MSIYEGIGPHKGQIIDNDADAIATAMSEIGLCPVENWAKVDMGLLLGYFDLEGFFSGDWIIGGEKFA